MKYESIEVNLNYSVWLYFTVYLPLRAIKCQILCVCEIYIYIYIYIFYTHTNFIKHNRHFMSTYFLLDPFEFPYYFYHIRGRLTMHLSDTQVQ